MAIHEVRDGAYLASSDPARLDLDVIHGYLRRAYWSEGIPRETVRTAIEHSLCVGVYRGSEQVGFARAVTDRATFAYVADVFVLEEHRGHGAGKLLIACLTTHPELQGLRTWLLLTRDAHGLYRQFGFGPGPAPERVMMKSAPYLFRQAEEKGGPDDQTT
jgi:N-acetylglutamate synthase-like GNAT family acetyltransferase